MLDTKFQCPVCGLKGPIRTNNSFEFIGRQNGYPVIKCTKCSTEIVLSSPYYKKIIGYIILVSTVFILVFFLSNFHTIYPLIITLIGIALINISSKPKIKQINTKGEMH